MKMDECNEFKAILFYRYNAVNILDFTVSWRSGLGFNALIHSHRPDIIDYEALVPQNHIDNLNNAFKVGQQELGIAPLLDAEGKLPSSTYFLWRQDQGGGTWEMGPAPPLFRELHVSPLPQDSPIVSSNVGNYMFRLTLFWGGITAPAPMLTL